jgi:hypothetical protein
MSVLDELRALDAKRAELLERAKADALEAAEKCVGTLNELGFHYTLVEGAERAPRKAGAEAPKRQARDVPCPICHFKTDPRHDGRAHRSQETKKPFTSAELTKWGYKKVE